jgi:preprotein translocase subunit SecG
MPGQRLARIVMIVVVVFVILGLVLSAVIAPLTL